MCLSYQQTVEEDVAKHSQTANDEVNEVVEELKVQHHGFVAACEGPSVPHETDQEDDFITHLQDKVSRFSESSKTRWSFWIWTDQHSLGRGLWVGHGQEFQTA